MKGPDYMVTGAELSRRNASLRAKVVKLHAEKSELTRKVSQLSSQVENLKTMLKADAKKMETVKPEEKFEWTDEFMEKCKNDKVLKADLEDAFYTALLAKKEEKKDESATSQ